MTIKSLLIKIAPASIISQYNNPFSDKLNPDEIKRNLKTSFLHFDIVYFEKTSSTNKIAKDLADRDAGEGMVVIAEEQTEGRGRLDRKWLSTPYKNILMSIMLRPALPPSELFYLTMICSIAVVKAIKKVTGLKASIKWPNDIYYNNKKLAGILTELEADMDKIKYVIAGIGLNVNFDPSEFPEIEEISTSLYKECGRIISRNKLLKAILQELDKQYDLLLRGRIKKIRKEWTDNSMIIGKPVIIYSEDYSEEGIAESFAEDGSLVLLKNNGEKKNIFSGDVSLRVGAGFPRP